MFRFSRETVTRGICTTNNCFIRSRIFDSKTKIKFHWRTGKHLVYTGHRSLFCWQKWLGLFWFAWIRKKKNSDSEYGFRPRSDPCETRFVGTYQSVTGAEFPWRIKNKIYIYTQTIQISKRECWTPIAYLAETLCQGREALGSKLGDVWKSHVRFEMTCFENWLNSQNARAIIL